MTCRLTLADIDTATESPDGGSPETIEFFLGLRRAGLPVRLIDSDSLVARLQETDMIGIVSEWEHPWYRATIEGVYVQDVVQLIAIFKNKVCESLEKTENSKFDERKLGRETVRSWARKKE